MFFKNKKVTVMGLGLQGGGLGLVKYLVKHGAHVTVTDLKTEQELTSSIVQLEGLPVTYVLGNHRMDDFKHADYVFKGPRVCWDNPYIKTALDHGIPIDMETAYFMKHTKNMVIGVTGTRGKSTTTHLIHQMLLKTGKKAVMGGNIPGTSTISLLDILTPDEIVVLELSSWQLSGFHRHTVSPHIGVFTSFSPDHLDYYQNMEDYFYDKSAIYAYMNANNAFVGFDGIQEYLRASPLPTILENITYVRASDFPVKLIHLHGHHNKLNASYALAVAKRLDIPYEIALQSILSTEGLPYRQELVGEVDGVTFINDTTSTTPTACIQALKTFCHRPIVLLFGGTSKGLPTEELIEALSHASYIVLLKGSFTDEILPKLKQRYAKKISHVFSHFDDAVIHALNHAKKLDNAYVLLSPGAASFSMFRNEFHRGEEFNRIVKESTDL